MTVQQSHRQAEWGMSETFPQWCLVCARQVWDNSCGHFTSWRTYASCGCGACLLLMPDLCDNDPENWDTEDQP